MDEASNAVSGLWGRLGRSGSALVLCLAFAASCSASPDRKASPIETAFNEFDQFQGTVVRRDPTTHVAASRIHDRYRALFSPYQTRATIAKLGRDDVALLFRAADLDFFYTVSPASLTDLKLDLSALRSRRAARQDQYETVYAALLESRLFDEARAFAKAHPLVSSQSPPDVADTPWSGRPSVLVVENGGKKLERTPVDLAKGRRIVVLSSPLCHFSQRAVRSIESDPVLRPLFRDHALWLVPPDQSTPFATVATWNRLHPNEQMKVAYRRDEWAMVDRWETPVFYFFKDGRVVGKVSGWPVAGRKTEIRRSMRLAGLM